MPYSIHFQKTVSAYKVLSVAPCINSSILNHYSATHTARKIPFMCSFSGNCAVPISTFICLWVIYLFPGSVYIFGCSKIDWPILEITDIWSVGIGRQSIINLFWKKGGCTVSFLGIHKWEPDIYIGFSPALHLQCIILIQPTNHLYLGHSMPRPVFSHRHHLASPFSHWNHPFSAATY